MRDLSRMSLTDQHKYMLKRLEEDLDRIKKVNKVLTEKLNDIINMLEGIKGVSYI